MLNAAKAPLAFRPEYEVPAPDEAETFAGINEALRHIVGGLCQTNVAGMAGGW